jgi:hypothetical protein
MSDITRSIAYVSMVKEYIMAEGHGGAEVLISRKQRHRGLQKKT